ncbi:hypothetical protein GCM10007962_17070 [Yeosuana aromativorans]|uniref:Uncharacterized protein n=1 Tax=Yeosuana aromativorans TaxID=288019 RepID=A0A8J3FJF6_9FLAO|nr:T9SS type A sorting domain-containing protein [Yeosuana aromativorans]GGK23469.1 hypothetical protein GCM10007962_17070 [Yeosuana aromativorans]
MKKIPSVFILTLLVLSGNLFSQNMLREIPLSQQIINSDLVIEGKVISKISYWENNLIYTKNTIQVYKVFKGNSVATVDVVTEGGRVGLEALDVSSALKLRNNDTGVFLLKQDANSNRISKTSVNKTYKAYSAIQGFYKYDLMDNIATNPFNKKQGISSAFYDEIKSITRKNYVEVSGFNAAEINKSLNQNKTLAAVISSFNPTTATAGTQNQLTINGSGFGTSIGAVGFADADNGGAGFVDALETQIVSWNDNEIVVEIPSGAGTGKVRVTPPSSSSAISSSDLTVSYSELNVVYDADDHTGDTPPGVNGPLKPIAYPLQHYGQSFQTGGYIWKMQTDFFNDTEHPGAKAAFERALETWRCTTKINWTISNTPVATDVKAKDNINVIRFDNGSELGAGVLGTCYSYYNGCSNGGSYDWYVSELDIVFDDATTWYYGTGIPTLAYDFESVAVHELGHGHQLGHVVNTNAIMHYNISAGEANRTLSSDDIAAGNDIQSRSTTNQICLLDLMTNYAGSCSLGVDDIAFNDAVKIYPNPSHGEFYISNELNVNLTKATVYDLSGRQISEFIFSDASKTKSINLPGASKGIYFVNIHSDSGFVTKKIVIE